MLQHADTSDPAVAEFPPRSRESIDAGAITNVMGLDCRLDPFVCPGSTIRRCAVGPWTLSAGVTMTDDGTMWWAGSLDTGDETSLTNVVGRLKPDRAAGVVRPLVAEVPGQPEPKAQRPVVDRNGKLFSPVILHDEKASRIMRIDRTTMELVPTSYPAMKGYRAWTLAFGEGDIAYVAATTDAFAEQTKECAGEVMELRPSKTQPIPHPFCVKPALSFVSSVVTHADRVFAAGSERVATTTKESTCIVRSILPGKPGKGWLHTLSVPDHICSVNRLAAGDDRIVALSHVFKKDVLSSPKSCGWLAQAYNFNGDAQWTTCIRAGQSAIWAPLESAHDAVSLPGGGWYVVGAVEDTTGGNITWRMAASVLDAKGNVQWFKPFGSKHGWFITDRHSQILRRPDGKLSIFDISSLATAEQGTGADLVIVDGLGIDHKPCHAF